jgi:hypothetical protein
LRLGGYSDAGLHCRKSKVFFFEKKKQKTFVPLAAAFPDRLGPGCKSFLVLFFQKRTAFFPFQGADKKSALRYRVGLGGVVL